MRIARRAQTEARVQRVKLEAMNEIEGRSGPFADEGREINSKRADGPDYEDGAAVPKPLAYPKEVDDTNYLADRCMELGLLVLAALFVGNVSVLVGAFALLVALRG